MTLFKRFKTMLEQFRGLKDHMTQVQAQLAELQDQVAELQDQVAELQARLSVVDGRSFLNAERNVRTHSSVQNLAEDAQSVSKRLRKLTRDLTQAQAAAPKEQ